LGPSAPPPSEASARSTRLKTVIEKPTPTVAEQQLLVGLGAGYYLCFFGMHVLPPGDL